MSETPRCSFCGRDKSESLILIAGIEGHICEVCVEQAMDIVNSELHMRVDEGSTDDISLPEDVTPVKIKESIIL